MEWKTTVLFKKNWQKSSFRFTRKKFTNNPHHFTLKKNVFLQYVYRGRLGITAWQHLVENFFVEIFFVENFFVEIFSQLILSSNGSFRRMLFLVENFLVEWFFWSKDARIRDFRRNLKCHDILEKKNLNVCAQAISYFFGIFSFMIMSNFENMQNPTKEICQTFRVSNINTQISIIGVSFQLVLCPFQLLIL